MRLNAINPSFSVWVNASAGTGKTKILIDRVLRLLLENKKNILCLTFTNAAANEMESRIHSMLSKWAICPRSVLAEDLEQLGFSLISPHTSSVSSQYQHLSFYCSTFKSRENESQVRRLFSELENLCLTIQTIHAFSYKLISSFPFEVGVAPNCTLSECKELHSIVFDKTLHNETIQDDINFIAAEIDENKLRDLLFALCSKEQLLADDLEYIKDKLCVTDKIYELESETIQHVEKLAEILGEGSKRDQIYSKILYDWCNSSVILACSNGSQKKINMDSSFSYLNDVNMKNLINMFLKSESNEKKSISSIITKLTLEKFKDAKEVIENIQNLIFTYVRDMNSYQIFKRTSSLLKIFKVYVDLYNNEKLRKALLDYNDIIHLAKNFLGNPEYKDWVLFNIHQKIDHILIDEAQDNSINQWRIIENLCDEFFTNSDGKRTLFIVGDVKQSIYRFQNANPYLFNYMQQYFRTKTCDKDWISCKLEKSFRSTPHILSFIDRLFNNFREEISFSDSEIKHIPYRENDQGYIEIWPLLPRYKEEEQQALQIHLTQRKSHVIVERLLAQTIVQKVHIWLNEGRILIAKNRHIEPRDIIILIRQRNILVDYLISEFKKVNIPVLGRDYFRIMDYIVVQDLIALAEFLLLPTNDLALANVLKSPLFNFTEDDLFNVAYDRKEHSLFEKLEDYHRVIYNELNYLINLSRTNPSLTLFTHVLCTGKKKFAARLGVECFEILDEFMNLVLQFENQSLQVFVQWIKENNPEIKTDMKSERNAVKIMTIHKSKGLQAPIVFLIDTNTVPRNSESILFDVIEAPFWCERNYNAYCDQVKRERKLEDYNEYLRLLYVALTRAEDELYILGKEPVQKGSWYDLITKYGEPYEKRQIDLYPMFKEKVEVLCMNLNYPSIYKKLDYFDVPIISPPQNLLSKHLPFSFRNLMLGSNERNIDSSVTSWNNVMVTKEITDYHARGLIIHRILQYMPKIEKDRRKNWVREYLDNMNIMENKDEIYNKILAFNDKYDYLFDLEGKSEVTLSGTIEGESILARIDRMYIMQDKIIIIDYKSQSGVSVSSLKEIKKQMSIYKTLVRGIYPNKKIECMIIWIEDLTIQSDF